MIRIHVLIVAVMTLFFVPMVGHGYGFANSGDESVVERGIRVQDIELDQAAYTVEDTAVLTFTVQNVSDVVQPGLVYRVDVVAAFDETTGVPASRVSLGEVVSLPTLLPQQAHEVTVRTVLPAYAAATDTGFQVSVFNPSTELVGRAHVRMLVTGIVRPSVTYIAQVQVDGEPFALLTGPTVDKGEQVSFAASLKSGRGTYTLTPHVAVYEGFAPLGTPISSFEGEAVPVGTARSTEQRMSLPHFEYTPGTYTAVIEYKDSEGVSYAGPFIARYVVAGGEPQLHSALPTKVELAAQDTFEVVVTYLDVPKNISLEAAVDPASYTGNMETEITVVDAENVVIGQQRVPFLPGKTSVRVPFTAPHYIYGMRIVTALFEDGVLRDRMDTIVPDVHSLVAEQPTQAQSMFRTHGRVLVAGGALLLIVLVVSYVLVRRWRRA